MIVWAYMNEHFKNYSVSYTNKLSTPWTLLLHLWNNHDLSLLLESKITKHTYVCNFKISILFYQSTKWKYWYFIRALNTVWKQLHDWLLLKTCGYLEWIHCLPYSSIHSLRPEPLIKQAIICSDGISAQLSFLPSTQLI